MFDNSGHRLTTDPHSGELQTGQLALPDILEQLDITEQPNMDLDTHEHTADLLTTRPKDSIGRSVYQYFTDASPPGQYAGKVVSYQHQGRLPRPAGGGSGPKNRSSGGAGASLHRGRPSPVLH